MTKVISLLQNIDLSLGKDIPEAFDPNVNRKLTSQTPPRPVELVSHEQSYKEFGLLIGRLASICTVVDFPSVTSLMVSFFLIRALKGIDIYFFFMFRIISFLSHQHSPILMHFHALNLM